MQWKWNAAKPSGNRPRRTVHNLSGGSKVNAIIGLLVIVIIAWGVMKFSAPYLRQSRFEHLMGEEMRELVRTGEDKMIQDVIQDAVKTKLPPITRDNIHFEGGVGKDSVMTVKYNEQIRLYDDKWYIIPIVAEKELHIPNEIN
jgi:hypothetical protein